MKQRIENQKTETKRIKTNQNKIEKEKIQIDLTWIFPKFESKMVSVQMSMQIFPHLVIQVSYQGK